MENIHILPTDNQYKGSISLTPDGRLSTNVLIGIPQNIYITSNEEIKEGDWCIADYVNGFIDSKGNPCNDGSYYIVKPNNIVLGNVEHGQQLLFSFNNFTHELRYCKKIILTTDPDLIKDGVQAIDDAFLEWFVKNPSCEFVEVKNYKFSEYPLDYKIIIPQEEPKQIKCYCGHTITCDCEPLQETLKEFINQSNTPEGLDQFSYDKGLEDGAKWQKERMEEDMINFAHFYFKEEFNSTMQTNKLTKELLSEWFEQNKKKFG